MKRRHALNTAFAASLVLAACNSHDIKTATTSTTSTSTTLSTTTTTSPLVNDQSKLTVNGLGGLKAGVAIADASKAAGVQIVELAGGTGDDTCLNGKIMGGPAGVSLLTEHHVITRVDVKDGSAIKTLSGVGIGSSEADVKVAYPSVTISPSKYGTGHNMTYTTATDPNMALLLETDGDKVTSMRSGRADIVALVEGCS